MKENTPPAWIIRLMTVLINTELWENIEGDLYEIFELESAEYGRRKASIRYIFHALGFLRFRRLRSTLYSPQRHFSAKTQITMDLFNNYLKVSWRDLKRNKKFAIINLTGLIAGFTACLFILQYVFYETGFDKFHENPQELYRVINDRYQNGELVQHGQITYPLVGQAMKDDFPEIVAATRLTTGSRNYVKKDDQLYMIEDFLYADEFFLEVFNFPMIDGESATALDDPYEVVITESFAKRFLKHGEKTEDLIGQAIRIFTNAPPCKISGVLSDVPSNSHLQFELLISFETMVSMSGGGADESWQWSDFYHYVRLAPQSDLTTVNRKLTDFSDKYFKNGEVSGSVEQFYLQPLTEAHLNSDLEYEIGVVRNGKTVWMMLITAIFMVVIAWVNFLNLSTSRATERAKEVGVRKSLGAPASQLFWQFLAESVLVNGIALVIAVVLVALLSEPYRILTGLPLSMSDLLTTNSFGVPYLLLYFPLFLLCLVIISLYPASIMSRFHTKEALKSSGQTTILRKGLVVFQFVAALVLITGSFTLNRQIQYMQDHDLGMTMENNLVLFGPSMSQWDSTFIDRFDDFRHELESIPGVESVTASSRVFSQQMSRWFGIKNQSDPEAANLSTNLISTDYAFIDQFEIELLAGRTFQRADHNFDGRKVNNLILNRTAVDHFKLGDPHSAIGKKLEAYDKSWEVVGVTADFHQRSLHQKMEPIILTPYLSTEHYIVIKTVNPSDETLNAKITGKFEKFFPGNYLDYFYLDDYYAEKYAVDKTVGKIAFLFTALAILIAILGLYGLVLITINRKVKEIAVRKVLGASLNHIMLLLGKNFMSMILIATVIGIPFSYQVLRNWLDNYAYSNGVEWWVPLTAACLLILISVATVYMQAGKVANNNPSESLKSE